MNYKKFTIVVLSILLAGVFLVATTVAYVDPFFHYHKPRPEFYYSLRSERYQNDGILKHFDYDAIITGTSMTQNFKTSEFNKLFDVNSIKVSYAGARFKEVNDAIKVAYKSGKELKYVVRSLDLYSIIANKNVAREDLGDYPVYLYNDNVWDDVNYLLNKDAFFRHSLRIVKDKIKGRKPGITSFDEYKNWNKDFKFGKEEVLQNLWKSGVNSNFTPNLVQKKITSKDIVIAIENIKENVIELAQRHPETTFYYFFPPYSIVWWAVQYGNSEIEKTLAAEELVIKMVLECPNIKLFSFNLMTDVITDLSNYKDMTHYGEWINTDMLRYMKEDVGLITKENYKEYLRKEQEFYLNYDYQGIFLD